MQLKKVRPIIESSFVQLCIIFLAAILLKELGIVSIEDNVLIIFAYILALSSIPPILKIKEIKVGKIPYVLIILISIFLFTFAVRLLPYAENSVPLGYDAGLYKHVIELYADNLPDVPEAGLPEWVKSAYPQGLFLLTNELHIFGFDSIELIKIFFPFLCAFLIFPLFVVTREFFDERTAIIAAILCALSATQFHVFSLLYFKNVLALILMLVSIYFLKKERYALLILSYTALGACHKPTFLLFTLILILYLGQLVFSLIRSRNKEGTNGRSKNVLIKKIKFTILTLVAVGILLMPFYLTRIDLYYNVLSSAVDAPSGGTFINFQEYEWLSIAYLPFALIGFLYLAIKRDFNLLFLWAAVNGSIVVFKLLFYNRFIIPLDLIFIILGAIGLNYVFLDSKKISKRLAVALLLLVFISSGVILAERVQNTRASITENQLEAVVWLSKNTEDGAYMLALSYDAPWVLGWSKRRVIAPGLFEYDRHETDEWREFFRTKDLNETKEFLSVYERPLYIYHSGKYKYILDLEKFDSECFEKVYDRGAVIYRYLC